jgi:hypothetical protein
MATEPCPPPLWARLRIRAELPGEPAVTLEGMLQAIPPDTLRLTARFGAFRPAFVLLADADSSELLLHSTREVWVTPREAPDWTNLNPSAWTTALAWALCPADLFRRLRANDPGRVEGRLWTLTGEIEGSPWSAVIAVNTRSRSLVDLALAGEDGVAVRVRAVGHGEVGGAWLPERMEIARPADGLLLRIERLAGGHLAPGDRPSFLLLRPPGWIRNRSGRLDLELPDGESPRPAPPVDREG